MSLPHTPSSARLLSDEELAALGKSTVESFVESSASGDVEGAHQYAAAILKEWTPRILHSLDLVARFLTVAEEMRGEGVRNDVWEAAVASVPPETLIGLVRNFPLPDHTGPSTCEVLDETLTLSQAVLKVLIADRGLCLGTVNLARLEKGLDLASAAVSAGRYAEACLLVGGLHAGYRDYHDGSLLMRQSVLRQLNRFIGEDAVLAAWTVAAEQIVPGLVHGDDKGGQMNSAPTLAPEDMLRMAAAGMRGHLSGPNANGSFVVRETDDQFIMEFDACGSGGRIRRMEDARELFDSAGLVSSPQYWTAGEENVPLYCSHCFVYHEIVAVDIRGKEDRFTLFNPDPQAPCVWSIYKNTESVPVELRNRTLQP